MRAASPPPKRSSPLAAGSGTASEKSVISAATGGVVTPLRHVPSPELAPEPPFALEPPLELPPAPPAATVSDPVLQPSATKPNATNPVRFAHIFMSSPSPIARHPAPTRRQCSLSRRVARGTDSEASTVRYVEPPPRPRHGVARRNSM